MILKRDSSQADQQHKSMIKDIQHHHNVLLMQKVRTHNASEKIYLPPLLQQSELQSLQESLAVSTTTESKNAKQPACSMQKKSASSTRRNSIASAAHQAEVPSSSEMISPTEKDVLSETKRTLAVTVKKPDKNRRVRKVARKNAHATSHPRCDSSHLAKIRTTKSAGKENAAMDKNITSRCQPRALFNHDARPDTKKEPRQNEQTPKPRKMAHQQSKHEENSQKQLESPRISHHEILRGKPESSSSKYPSIPVVSKLRTNVSVAHIFLTFISFSIS